VTDDVDDDAQKLTFCFRQAAHAFTLRDICGTTTSSPPLIPSPFA
jgi:hypothetical protein